MYIICHGLPINIKYLNTFYLLLDFHLPEEIPLNLIIVNLPILTSLSDMALSFYLTNPRHKSLTFFVQQKTQTNTHIAHLFISNFIISSQQCLLYFNIEGKDETNNYRKNYHNLYAKKYMGRLIATNQKRGTFCLG